MLAPSPPTPDDHDEEATSSPEESPTVPDEVLRFTNLDKPVLHPYGSYGTDFVIEPSTEGTRLRTKAEILGDAPSPSSDNPSTSPESPHVRHWSEDLAALQSRTELLTTRVKNVLKEVQDSVGRRARTVRIAE